MLKAATIYFTAFIFMAVSSIAPGSYARNQARRGGGEHPSPDAAARAETLLQNALLLADNGQGEAARLQLREAMALWVRTGEPGKAAKAALHMGDHCKRARKYHDALNYYRLARDTNSLPGTFKANALTAI